MKFMLSIYGDENRWGRLSPAEQKEILAAYEQFAAEAVDAGVLLNGDGLQGTDTAATVRVRDGQREVTDGPFMETKEQLGGYFVVDCRDLDDAIGWAARIPGAQAGAIEVRPVMDYPAADEIEVPAGQNSAVG